MSTLNQVLKHKRKLKKRRSKSPSLGKNPQKKGVCVKVYTTSPKKPNSAVRKIAKVVFTSNQKSIIGYIPGQGHNLQKFSNVLVRGGKTQDLPGVRYKLMRGCLDFDHKETIKRKNRRSKYGVPKPKSED